ncbi:beta-lactamase family protein [Halanaerobiaceae bacterium Z-7014]|uniref:Beta-lactamase family protein n=1 Tax=Halonatronomonas betaini TaxID=2778430 RepID=A0A931ATL3_9FIRM|nr:beta-lactamase family protein [Halonatronomonas betaini]
MQNKNLKISFIIILALLLLFSGSEILEANSHNNGFQDFLDGVFQQQLEDSDIPGIIAVAVDTDGLIYSNSFGHADLAENKELDPGETLMRTGSTGKIFTWLALLQQAEAGNIDLEEDINYYLPENLQFDYDENEPIRVIDLMTHTPGFEDIQLGILVSSIEDLVSLEDYLGDTRPEIVRNPGEVPAYSNYGTTLAGYIIERVTGLSYHEYLERNIFRPLRMNNASSRQDIFTDSEIASNISTGYFSDNRFLQPGEFEIFQEYPAGGHTVTGYDMANLMFGILNDGELLGWRFLSQEYNDKLFERVFSIDEEMAGWTHGLMEFNLKNQTIYWHGGDTLQFHTGIFFIPEEEKAIFVAYNGPGGTMARLDLINALDRQYFASESYQPVVGGEEIDSNDYQGEYLPSRRNYSTPEKLISRFSQIRISVVDNHLIVDGHQKDKYYKLEEDRFINQSGDAEIKFYRDEDGSIDYFAYKNNPTNVFTKVSLLESSRLHLSILGFALLVFLITPISNLILLFKNEKVSSFGERDKIPAWPGIILSVIGLAYSITQTRTFLYLMENPFSWPEYTGLLSLVPVLMILLLLLMVYQLIKFGPLSKRFISQLILIFVGSAFIILLYYYNFIGFLVF